MSKLNLLRLVKYFVRLGSKVVKCLLHVREVSGSNPGKVRYILTGQKYLTQSPLVIGIIIMALTEEQTGLVVTKLQLAMP